MYSVWIVLLGAGIGICAALIMLADAILNQVLYGISLFLVGFTLWTVTRPVPGGGKRQLTFQQMAEARARESVERHKAEIDAMRIVQGKKERAQEGVDSERLAAAHFFAQAVADSRKEVQEAPRRSSRFMKDTE